MRRRDYIWSEQGALCAATAHAELVREATAPSYPPDLVTDVVMLDEIFELQSQRAFALMRKCGVEVPRRDPEARRRQRAFKP